MSVHAMPNLDIKKFRKIYALVSGGATYGEKAAAKARATAMAKACGLTFAQAVSKLDAPKPQPKNIFEDLFNSPEMKAQKAEREIRYAARRAEILGECGTVKAILDPTHRETLIMKAGKPFITKRSSYIDVCGTRRQSINEFAGVSGQFFKRADVQPEAVEAIKTAYPFPETIYGAFEELRKWDKLNSDRAHFYSHHEYYFDLPIELRINLLRDVMREQPVTSWDDLEARFHYKSYEWQQQWIDERDFDDPEWARLFADCRILRAAAEAVHQEPVQTGRRTNAGKRNAVLSMLDTKPELSDREISRRVGVSPQTVTNWRNRTAQNGQVKSTGGRNA